MSRRGLLRSLGRCCLGLVALLVAGGAAVVLPVSLNCPLPLRSSGSTHGSSLQFCNFSVYGENACVLEGRHGGLVGTKALGENDGPCLLNGYDYGFVFGFSNVFFCKPVDVVEGIFLRACYFDAGVSDVGVGGG